MGYFYNWLDEQWDRSDHTRKLTREQVLEIERRKALIGELIKEIEASGDSLIKLYAGLLARTLTATVVAPERSDTVRVFREL
jgi:hypothetical protein